MDLMTNLKHLRTADELKKFIEENEKVMVCCGRMGPMCIPVYEAMEEMEDEYGHVKFADMNFDIPEAHIIRNAPETAGFMGLPFTMFYKNGKVVEAVSSIMSDEQIKAVLDSKFA